MKHIKLCLPLLLVFISGCFKKDFGPPPEPGSQSIEQMVVAPGFKFNTGATIDLELTALDNMDNPVPGIRVNLYSDYPEAGGKKITSYFTGSDGTAKADLKLPAYADSVVVETAAIGFVQWQKRKIENGTLHFVLGGRNPAPSGRPGAGEDIIFETQPLPGARPTAGPVIKALGSFKSNGVPNYLMPANDVVDAAFIRDINTALPENRPVPQYNPEYLNDNYKADLTLLQPAQVWVTFVHEGAGYKNVLCYYTYPINDPPTSTSDIDTLFAIFPNVSYVNSGGGLVSGNKVEIGTFSPGTGIGFALIANGYNGSSITNGLGIFYSEPRLNPETTPSLKKHCILLNDVNRSKFLLSFDDQNRQTGGSDNDFNDAIFYVTSNPIQAILVTEIARPAYSSVDYDGDGVTDNFDDFPQDRNLAFSNFYPAQNGVGTLAFEDLWPSRGDYDFNDLVVDYNFNTITNARNEIVQINATLSTKAIGASYHNGFGIQLPISPSLVASVTGTDTRGSLVTRNANGTEAGQSKATIILYEDAFSQLPWPGGGTGVNTTLGGLYVPPATLNVSIRLTTPVSPAVLGLPPYNPFIFINKVRSHEVHLVDQKPTDLANTALFGTQHDNSNPATGRYYVTSRNLPFAIDVAGPFEHPVEKKVITETYLKFFNWGTSGGKQSRDWFLPLPANTNANNVFKP